MRARLNRLVSDALERTHDQILRVRPGPGIPANDLRSLRFEAARLARVVHLLRPRPTQGTLQPYDDLEPALNHALLPAAAEAQRRSLALHTRVAGLTGMKLREPTVLEAFLACVEDTVTMAAGFLDVHIRPAYRRLQCQLTTDAQLHGAGLGMMVLREVMQRSGENTLMTVERDGAGQTRLSIGLSLALPHGAQTAQQAAAQPFDV